MTFWGLGMVSVYTSEVGGKSSKDSPTGKSVSVSFRVRVVRASGRGEAAWAREGCASSPLGFRVANYPPPRGQFPSKSCCSACGF